MIISEYGNEQHIVHEFIRFTQNSPLSIDLNKKIHLLIWGYEFWLPDGGKKGYTGAIDLLGTDEEGNVWLIEAKQSANPELSPVIWDNQILRYRKALSRRSHEEITLKTRRFLSNRGTFSSSHSNINYDFQSLYDVFKQWSFNLGRDESFAQMTYNLTLHNIQNENVICTVVADVFRRDVWENRPKDSRSYAYIKTRGTGDDFETTTLIEKNESGNYQNDHDYSSQVSTWSDLIKQKESVKPTPETIEIYLTNRVVEYYRECISRLKDLGWDNKYKSNTKAFIIDMPTIFALPIRIHLGWIDFDGSFSMENRIPGELGMKFNIDFRHFKKGSLSEHKEIGYELAKRLAAEARYNGRKAGLNLQIRDLTEDEKNSWDWEMYRRIDKENRDYLGREDERNDFEAAWSFLRGIIKVPST